MQDPILTIHDTHITLPSGKQIALDALNRFTPNKELWDLWQASKLDVKRAGVGITKEDGRWQGYVRGGDGGFSYSPSDIHAYWRSKAEELAESSDCEAVIVSRDELGSEPVPCQRHTEFRLHAQQCRNDTYQIRLHCDLCGKKTQGAIAWDRLGQDLVIRSIAFALQEQRSESEEVSELSDIKWV